MTEVTWFVIGSAATSAALVVMMCLFAVHENDEWKDRR